MNDDYEDIIRIYENYQIINHPNFEDLK